jgi:hypothetical protein
MDDEIDQLWIYIPFLRLDARIDELSVLDAELHFHNSCLRSQGMDKI